MAGSANDIVDSWLLIFFTLLIPAIFENTKDIRIDNFVGDFSYLIYIVHIPVILCILQPYGFENGEELFVFTSVISVLIASVLSVSVDRFVKEFRKRNYASGY